MNVAINRLDPNLPDPVESRRRAAGRMVRISYAIIVFGILGFFVVYFGRPIVYLSGPGTVSSQRHVISLPYTVQISRMDVAAGDTVKAGDTIGQVLSPQHDQIVATYMRAMADLAGRQAELNVKARVAKDSLAAARSYSDLTEEAVERLEGSSGASLNYRVDISRQHALARNTVVSQEAEAAETTVQLAALHEFDRRLRDNLEQVERHFSKGRIVAPIAGIVATNGARVGQSLVAGAPIAEILNPADIFVDWHIPNERLVDPQVGNEVFVLFGNRRILGAIAEILPVSDVYGGTQMSFARERTATQIARIRFNPGAEPPALGATVYVHMHYTNFSQRLGSILVRLSGFDRM